MLSQSKHTIKPNVIHDRSPDRPITNARLLIPATKSSVDLCKSMLSGLVLGYPTPVLINWGQSSDLSNQNNDFNDTTKITGILKYLKTLKSEQDAELIMISDASSTWFQLRPEVFLTRYRDINKSLIERAKDLMGATAFAAEDVFQSILFSAGTSCGPVESQKDEVGCYAQPESPLPQSLFGPDNDPIEEKTGLPLHTKPSFLNPAFMAGPASDMKAMFIRAAARIGRAENQGSDQHIFNEIYGEQHYQREIMRLQHRSMLQRLSNRFAKIMGTHKPSIIDPHPTHKPLEWLPDHPLESGVGVDYGMELVQSSSRTEVDGQFLNFGNEQRLWEQQVNKQVKHPRVKSIPLDIPDSPWPFISLHVDNNPNSIAPTKWVQVKLYTNLWTTSVPVAIHIGGSDDASRGALWERMWYRGNARELLTARARFGEVGAYSDEGHFILWEDLCGEYEQEVFGDNRGPWTNPDEKQREKVEVKNEELAKEKAEAARPQYKGLGLPSSIEEATVLFEGAPMYI